MNIIEEFVTKFSGLKEQEVKKYQEVIEITTPKPVRPSVQRLPAQIAPQQLEHELSTFLQISNISHMNFSLQDDTFYRATSVNQIS